jgi:hypothetical protein
MKRAAIVTGTAAAIAGLALGLERLFLAGPHYRGPKSDHFDGKRLHNHQSGWQSEASFIKWMMNREQGPWREWVDDPLGPKPPARVDDLRVTFVNHATTLIQMNGVNILTDPMWSDRCSPVQFAGPKRHRPPGIRFEDLPVDAVLAIDARANDLVVVNHSAPYWSPRKTHSTTSRSVLVNHTSSSCTWSRLLLTGALPISARR